MDPEQLIQRQLREMGSRALGRLAGQLLPHTLVATLPDSAAAALKRIGLVLGELEHSTVPAEDRPTTDQAAMRAIAESLAPTAHERSTDARRD